MLWKNAWTRIIPDLILASSSTLAGCRVGSNLLGMLGVAWRGVRGVLGGAWRSRSDEEVRILQRTSSEKLSESRLTFLLGVFLGVRVVGRGFCRERGVWGAAAEDRLLFLTTSSSLSNPASSSLSLWWSSSSSSLLLCSSFLEGTNSSSSSPSESGSNWLFSRFLRKHRKTKIEVTVMKT